MDILRHPWFRKCGQKLRADLCLLPGSVKVRSTPSFEGGDSGACTGSLVVRGKKNSALRLFRPEGLDGRLRFPSVLNIARLAHAE